MSDDKQFSVVNLGELSKPANTLIEKVSNAVGGIFKPYQIKRVAKAETEADLIKAKSEIEISDLQRRAMHRFVEEESKRQANIENITQKALPSLKEDSDPDGIENDWITNFFDKCRIISDDEMQNLWSRVLSGEANTPGSYSKRTVNFLSDLDKSEAYIFSKLCGFGWMMGEITPLILDVESEIYNKDSITFNSLMHLASIGLIQFNNLQGFIRQELPRVIRIFYYGQPLILEFNKESGNNLSIGKVLLTRIGQELAPICGGKSVDGFMEYIRGQYKNLIPDRATEMERLR